MTILSTTFSGPKLHGLPGESREFALAQPIHAPDLKPQPALSPGRQTRFYVRGRPGVVRLGVPEGPDRALGDARR